MNTGAALSYLLKLIFIGGCIYGLVTWQSTANTDGDARTFAEKACTDGVQARYNATGVRVYSIDESTSGFVVKASLTLARGTTAKASCVANRHGGVTDIYIQER